ncbi:MAG: hypothetical protein K0B37_18085, partial [Bacteroidales bacterium]|nr:hypothetical protein [Bacteroidales bacterium]
LELIGFTNWMRNFDETSFFKKTILVVNRFDKDLDFFKESFSSEPNSSGYMLQINQAQQNLLVKISTNSVLEKEVNLTISKNGKALKEFPITIPSKEPVVREISTENLGHGVYIFSLKNQHGSILAERARFVDKRPVANAHYSLKNSEFGAREKVALQIQLEDKEDTLDWVSVSVVQSALKKTKSVNYKLSFESPDLILQNGSSVANPSAGSGNHFIYFKETSHLTLNGRITDATTQNPVNGARIILNIPDTIVNLQYSNSNADGLFTFFLNSYYDDREIFLTPDPGTISGDVKIEIFDKFDFKIPFKPETFCLPTSYREAIIENQKIVEINKAFGISAQIESPENTIRAEPPRVFSNPIYSINTEEFIPLENLQEIALEIIGPWRIRRTRTGTSHSLVSNSTSNTIAGVPVLFIDGIITYDIEPLLPLNSRQIKTIELLNLEWKHGDMHFPGIVSIFTKNESFRELKLRPAPTRFFNTAHQFPARFVSPAHSNDDPLDGTPDLRPMLYWYSGQPTAEKGSYEFTWYTDDLPMDYLISIDGKTQNGNLIKIEIPLSHEK